MNEIDPTDPTGGASPNRPSRELDDLITRHLEGDLDASDQRRLAKMLAASPEARRCLAGYLRLEGATIRLASAGQLGGAEPGNDPGMPPAMTPSGLVRADRPDARDHRRSRRLRGAAVALAGGLVAAAVMGLVWTGVSGLFPRRGGDLDLLASGWMELQRHEHPTDFEPAEAALDAEDQEPDVAAPPRWLVAALVLEGAEAAVPDES